MNTLLAPKWFQSLIFLCLFGISFSLQAQQVITFSEPEDADNQVRFEVVDPPVMMQVRKDSLPYWSYFWEFGDGTYETVFKDPTVSHLYPESESDSDSYTATVYMTPRYAGVAERPIKIDSTIATIRKTRGSISFPSRPKKIEKFIELDPNQEPAFSHEVRFALKYRYDQKLVQSDSGHIVFFYNEAAFDLTPPFDFLEESSRVYNGEETVKKSIFRKTGTIDPEIRSTLINQYGAMYSKMKVWRYENLEKFAQRNLFFSLQTADTLKQLELNQFSVIAILIPDSVALDTFPLLDLEESPFFDKLEFEIKRSLDPNHMYVNAPLLLTNPVGEELVYKVEFQNIGEAPATKVTIGVAWSDFFDKRSLEVLEITPLLSTDNSPIQVGPLFEQTKDGEQLIFTFDNIDLRGTNETPKPLKELTKGYVKFSVKINDRIITTKKDKEGAIKKFNIPRKIPNRSLITFYGKTGKEDSLKTNGVATFLSRRRSYVNAGLNLPGWKFGPAVASNTLSNGFLNNFSVGVGRNLAQANRFIFNGEVRYNANFINQAPYISIDSLQIATLDLSFSANYVFGISGLGMFRLGAGAGGCAILFADQVGKVDYRFWDGISGIERERNQYSPIGLLGYVELKKSIFRKVIDVGLRYYGRYYPQLASNKGVLYGLPQVNLTYRLTDSKSAFIDQLNEQAGISTGKSGKKK